MDLSSKILPLASPVPAVSHGDAVSVPFGTVTAAFYHHALHTPNANAVLDISNGIPLEMSYGDLAEQAQRLASAMQRMGIKPRQKVPLIVKRSAEMITGILAILSCGAQYIPLDGGVVADSTIQHVINQCDADIVLCTASTQSRLKQLLPNTTLLLVKNAEIVDSHRVNPSQWVDLASPDAGCYIIYTSGTTGTPKGVDVCHRNVANLVCLSPGALEITPGTYVGQVLNISFDMAAWEIFSCLCNGGTLVIRGSKWEETLSKIHVLICTPTILSKYDPRSYPNIKMVATAGEATSQPLADLWATHATYWNCCGPTETTIVNTMSRHSPGEPVSIGRPTPNNSVYILDSEMKPVSVGESGMMWAGGYGVTCGYVGLEAQTANAYIPDTFANDGSKMYCTGDLGRWRSDGNIEIVGRMDDQVKVKGFRVELDGVSASISSAAGVDRAATLLIDGVLHSFVVPSQQDEVALRQHVAKAQPFYAIPSHFHTMDTFPATANGKIDKTALRAMVDAWNDGKSKGMASTHETVAASASSLTLTTMVSDTSTVIDTEKQMTLLQLPNKTLPKYLRNIRHRIFIVYRFLLSVTLIINITTIPLLMLLAPAPKEHLSTIVAANLTLAVCVRQDLIINSLYYLTCSVPKSAPMWLRRRCAKIYHLGGVHSGAGICATIWLVGSTFWSTFTYTGKSLTDSRATIVVSWMLVALLCSLVTFAWPGFRKTYHNQFERIHRFGGWTALALFWIRTLLAIRDVSSTTSSSYGATLVATPGFWMLCVATSSIASSWFWLRKVPVEAVPLSDHAIVLSFDYTVPVNGTFTRISKRPLLEWHSFATIPRPQPTKTGGKPGYSLVVSNAGDWTRECIRNPPRSLWVRGLPTSGVMRIATLFNRVVLIATGSGIGPCMGHITQSDCPTQLIWSTANPAKTFGKDLVHSIQQAIPDAIIHDTKKNGRPDLVKMGFQLAKTFRAEAVIIIANEKITKKVVYGLESRGLPAYGAIWDS